MPPTIAWTLSSGRPNSVPSWSADAAPIAAAVRGPASPDRRSIWICSPPAAASPPGTIRPNAFPASCEAATANQRFVPSAIRSTSQIAMKLTISQATASTAHHGSSRGQRPP